jgi:hypothetical protein
LLSFGIERDGFEAIIISLPIMSKFTRLYLRIPRPKVGHARLPLYLLEEKLAKL